MCSYKHTHNSAVHTNGPIWAIDLDGLEAKLAIWGNGAGDESTFKQRAIKYAAKLGGRVSVHSAISGTEFLNLLKSKTNSEGSIASFVMFSHGFQDGMILESANGFYKTVTIYGGGVNSANVQDLSDAVENGEIRFEDNAILVLGGCNCGGYDEYQPGIAQEIVDKIGVTVIASQGDVSPEKIDGKETGNLVSDKSFYKFEKGEDGVINSIKLGKTINPTDFDVDITLSKVKPKEVTSISPASTTPTISKN